MMLNLITDRTAQDVSRWRELHAKGYAAMTSAERAEWATSKGAYNHTDLNRVENAVAYIADLLTSLGYGVEIAGTKTWTAYDVPTVSDMNRFLSNVRLIRGAFSVMRTTPAVPSTMQRLTHVSANNIERILQDVEILANNMIAAFTYAGDIYGGEI